MSSRRADPRAPEEVHLSPAAQAVLRSRYLRRDASGRIVETPETMLERVAQFVAGAEDGYRPGSSREWADRFGVVLRQMSFLPNSPTLMNAGTRMGFLSGCVVLPIEDSLPAIFDTLGRAAVLHQAGAGTGYAFSHLRPAGDRVSSTGGTATGPVSFLRLFDTAAQVVRAGGRRRGAGMAVLDVSHPDIRDFVDAKRTPPGLSSFTLSVAVGDAFMRAVERDGQHRLINPRTGRTVARVRAAEVFDAICAAAAAGGEPGLLFLDTINRANPLPGRIEATNPCGEVPLLPYESCTLGSIDVARFLRHGRIRWGHLAEVVEVAVRFLDDVIDVNRYPFPELEQRARAARKIGLGIMGLADLLAGLGIPYDSTRGVRLAGRIARFVQHRARGASALLARERGSFPAFDTSRYVGIEPLRNAQRTSVAPTGTISLIAGTSSGIEPLFGVAHTRRVLDRPVVEVSPAFERVAHERGFAGNGLIDEVIRTGTVPDDPRVPDDVRRAFRTAWQIAPEWHLRMQSAIQRHVDAAVSKTVNLAPEASADDIRAILLSAWHLRVKGITVYRTGSRPAQVLTPAGGACDCRDGSA